MTDTDRGTAIMLQGVRVLGGPATDLLVVDGRIASVGPVEAVAASLRRVDCAGAIALPGLVDLHTHLREPGGERAETVATGTRAAAAGGYVAVAAMANTDPVPDTAEVVERMAESYRDRPCTVIPVGAVTRGLAGEQLADIRGMANSRAHVRLFSDDGRCVHDSALMRIALRMAANAGAVIAQHAEDPRLTVGAQVNDGPVADATGLTGWPAAAEESIIARDCVLASHEGAPLHVCHVSTAGAVEVIRWAKARGWPVTAEVTPHHLLLTEEAARSGDPVFKVNPPLRAAADVEALRAALLDGTIDAVATDHAPHHADDKQRPWCSARPGMVGLETAVAVVAEAMGAGEETAWATLADRMAFRPARIARVADRFGGDLVPGAPANLCLVADDPWRFDPSRGASRGRNSPVAGRVLRYRPVLTMRHGRVTSDVLGLLPTTGEER